MDRKGKLLRTGLLIGLFLLSLSVFCPPVGAEGTAESADSGAPPVSEAASPPAADSGALPVPQAAPPPVVDSGAVPVPRVPSPPAVDSGVVPVPQAAPPPTADSGAPPVSEAASPPVVDSGAVPVPQAAPPPVVDSGAVPVPRAAPPPVVDSGVVPVPRAAPPPAADSGAVPVPRAAPPPAADSGAVPVPRAAPPPVVDSGAVPVPRMVPPPPVDSFPPKDFQIPLVVEPEVSLPDDIGEPIPPPEDHSRPLALELEISSSQPAAGDAWALSLLIDHPFPTELTIKAPPFPSELILEQVRTEPRLVGPNRRRWTWTEFSFTLDQPGDVLILPIEVLAPGRKGKTKEFLLHIGKRSGQAVSERPFFRWLSVPSSLAIGETGDLTLSLSNGELPRDFFQGKAPRNAILEEFPSGKGRYHFRLIPLEGREVVLGPWEAAIGPWTIRTPRVVIPLRSSPAQAIPSKTAPPVVSAETPPVQGLSPALSQGDPFQSGLAPAFFLFRRDYEETVVRAKALWEAGNQGEALALLRGRERDSLAGSAFVPLRRTLEGQSGLAETGDETWKPWMIPVPFLLILGALGCGIFGFFCLFSKIRKRPVTPRIFRCFIYCGLFVVCLLGCLLWDWRESANGKSAVLRETPVYRTPGTEGSVEALFLEGQPVILRSWPGAWVYAEAPDGRAGWIPQEAVISY